MQRLGLSNTGCRLNGEHKCPWYVETAFIISTFEFVENGTISTKISPPIATIFSINKMTFNVCPNLGAPFEVDIFLEYILTLWIHRLWVIALISYLCCLICKYCCIECFRHWPPKLILGSYCCIHQWLALDITHVDQTFSGINACSEPFRCSLGRS